ncbi:MAG TPA: LD-carboxypeptidase [Oscillospiraceae bacterium]|nr:LD-carboxypeptidase [Oscillospiraceae bacterium]
MIVPKPLFPGARVALVCASSYVPAERLEPAVAAVRALGLSPVVYESSSARHGYFAGSDELRAGDLMRAFLDPAIDGVLCIRGGYGAHRLLPRLDVPAVAAHPKFFSGYSDVTSLHIAFNQAGLATWHTIMPSTEYYEPQDAYTMDHLRRALFGGLSGRVSMPAGHRAETLVSGAAEGRLCGGNLSLAVASLGTPWELDTRGKILFLEDVNEMVYRVDSMLTTLRNAGKFRDCAGVVLGYFTDCRPEDPAASLTLREVFEELVVPAGKPAILNFPCGHARPCCALPLGGMARLDADGAALALL